MVTGLDEVLKKLDKLPQRVQKNVLNGAIRAASKPIIKEARRLVPSKRAILRKSIGVVKRRSEDKDITHYVVAPLKKKIHKLQEQEGLDHYDYGRIVEEGTSDTVAEPFMRPAYEKEGENSIHAVIDYLRKRLDKEIAKL